MSLCYFSLFVDWGGNGLSDGSTGRSGGGRYIKSGTGRPSVRARLPYELNWGATAQGNLERLEPDWSKKDWGPSGLSERSWRRDLGDQV